MTFPPRKSADNLSPSRPARGGADGADAPQLTRPANGAGLVRRLRDGAAVDAEHAELSDGGGVVLERGRPERVLGDRGAVVAERHLAGRRRVLHADLVDRAAVVEGGRAGALHRGRAVDDAELAD